MDAKVLGEKISSLRKERGMTQKQLAELLHVTDGAVSKWERGRAQLVRQLRLRGCFKLVIEALILAAFIAASNIFAEHGIYGFAQSITGGMSGFVGILIGSELYALKNLPKLR